MSGSTPPCSPFILCLFKLAQEMLCDCSSWHSRKQGMKTFRYFPIAIRSLHYSVNTFNSHPQRSPQPEWLGAPVDTWNVPISLEKENKKKSHLSQASSPPLVLANGTRHEGVEGSLHGYPVGWYGQNRRLHWRKEIPEVLDVQYIQVW